MHLVPSGQRGSRKEGKVKAWLDIPVPSYLCPQICPPFLHRDKETGCAQNKGIQLQPQGQMGLKSPDKMPFLIHIWSSPRGVWRDDGNVDVAPLPSAPITQLFAPGHHTGMTIAYLRRVFEASGGLTLKPHRPVR